MNLKFQFPGGTEVISMDEPKYTQKEEFIKHWIKKIYDERFTAWEDLQESAKDEGVKLDPESLRRIKDAIEIYAVNPAMNAMYEIIKLQRGVKL